MDKERTMETEAIRTQIADLREFRSSCIADLMEVELSALEADNARMRKALDGLCRAIEHGDENRYAIVVQDGRKALSAKPLDTTNHCPLCEGHAKENEKIKAAIVQLIGTSETYLGVNPNRQESSIKEWERQVDELQQAIAISRAALTGSPAAVFVTLEELTTVSDTLHSLIGLGERMPLGDVMHLIGQRREDQGD